MKAHLFRMTTEVESIAAQKYNAYVMYGCILDVDEVSWPLSISGSITERVTVVFRHLDHSRRGMDVCCTDPT